MATKEELLKAKIPCPETGIEIRHTLCDICSPGSHCGIDAYVKDGVVIKIEGNKNHPLNRGLLCTKGASNRQYIYREDRVRTPLKRTGPRGSGSFEPISWEEAYQTISEKLLGYKQSFGAQSVFFFSGYSKWYRPILQRLCYSFGSPNYGTESSTCFTSGLMAWETATALPARPDMRNSRLFLGWAHNPYYTGYLSARNTERLKKQGVKFIIVDTMYTQTVEKIADLFLQPRPGTDGALALAIANELITNGWVDYEYIEKYVHGFEEYAEYCKGFHAGNIEALTGVPCEKVKQAAQMIHEYGPMSIRESSAPLGHHANGMQNYRAIMALSAITGNYDRKGGQTPAPFTYTHQSSGYHTWEHKFVREARKSSMAAAVGAQRFPLWNELEKEAQTMDLARQIRQGTPYPIKALLAFGMNFRMFPGSDQHMKKALEELEFFVDVDLFMTDTAKYADIVLPACSSFEREEFKSYPGGYAYYTKPVIPPLYESRPDTDIMCDLARYMNLNDPLLKAGYRACLNYILSPISYSVEQLQEADTPLKVPEFHPHEEYATISRGLNTPTGKFELKSELIASHPEWGLDPLPTYRAPYEGEDETLYPMFLTEGGRLPNALHSRLHDVSWLRTLRPKASAEIHPEDAAAHGIAEGDLFELSTANGSITVTALISRRIPRGMVSLYHGYREANYGNLIHQDRLDPYSGFPAFRSSTRCRISRKGEAHE
ncbi:MAG: molybdopterin-dependent oxidoreductase [Clostridiales bacterium]|nr:molybdopterin-dependent oxidoreductase [Clostridiales bacterium]